MKILKIDKIYNKNVLRYFDIYEEYSSRGVWLNVVQAHFHFFTAKFIAFRKICLICVFCGFWIRICKQFRSFYRLILKPISRNSFQSNKLISCLNSVLLKVYLDKMWKSLTQDIFTEGEGVNTNCFDFLPMRNSRLTPEHLYS